MCDIIIELQGSLKHTLNACALALKNNRNMLIKNPYPKLNTDSYNGILAEYNTKIEYNQDGLRVSVDNDSEQNIHPAESTRFEIDDPLALFLALRAGDKIKFRKDKSEDYLRKVLILRRLGFQFFEPDKTDTKAHKYDCITGIKPQKVKYNFLTSNYNLSEFMYLVSAVCDCEVELLAKFDIMELADQSIYPLKLVIDNLAQESDENDELQKRLAKLSKNKKRSAFHYNIKAAINECPDEITLPADPLLTAFCAAIAILNSESDIKITNLNPDLEANALCTMLSRLNANCALQKKAGDKSEHNYNLVARKSELTAKKIDEKKLRVCRQAFAPLALLAAMTAGKTILRGLPESSSLWRNRISAVAEILTSANVRVGEIEDGIVIESPVEYADIRYKKYGDPYLQLTQFCAALIFNSKPLTAEYFDFNNYYPEFHNQIKKIRSKAKMIAS